MPKVRTTPTVDADVLRAVKRKAARSGKGDGEVIEDAFHRELGPDPVERLWSRAQLTEDEATALAVKAQHATRRKSR